MEGSVTRAGEAAALRYVPLAELERLRALDADPAARAAAFADACRLNVLYMVARAGSGHIGTSFSSIDIVSWLHLDVLSDHDRYFSSKGHDAPGLYSVLIALGRLPFEKLDRLRRLGGLPGHPDVLTTPEVVTNTGSLGMGISKAKGFVLADRLAGRSGQVFVLTGDGELQEGQFWESLASAANRGLHEITAIVDHNKIQSDTWVADVSDLGDLQRKVESFGWATGRCDGNDAADLGRALGELGREAAGRPKLLVADTVKGAGVSFMEPHGLPPGGDELYAYHSGAPGPDEYERAVAEIVERLGRRLETLGHEPVRLEEAEAPARSAPMRPQKLVPAYGQALADLADAEPRLVALDADLILDTGLVEFRRRHPERFFECGIAEQDMVSQAGAMALAGLLPAVHSFGCFLSTRPNEQIYNQCTEGTKVVYAGSLVGLVPGGPGHSHQSVRDISALGAMPRMALLEPCSEHEVRLCLDWAVHEAPGSVYIRLVSVPWELGFEPPAPERLVLGRGDGVRAGADAVIVGAGPVVLSQAYAAAELLAERGVECTVIDLPWLRDVDGAWLAELAAGAPIFCVDNHYLSGGQGDAVAQALAVQDVAAVTLVRKIGVDRVPQCGTNDEVLRAHGLDAEGIAARVAAELPARV
ncbi:MAG: transketolase C-terminal domain-containing protein [Thermoleophilaceae bacterium]